MNEKIGAIAQDAEIQPASPMTRREFLKVLAGLFSWTAVVNFLAACSPLSASPKASTTKTPSPIPEPATRVDQEFSPDIFKYGLSPKYFTERETGEARVQAAIDYLGRVRSLLHDNKYQNNPSVNPTLADFRLADKNYAGDNAIFPISLMPGTTLADVLDIFFNHDLNQKTKVTFNSSKEKPPAETITNKFLRDANNRWEREETVISFNKDILAAGNFIERNNKTYSSATDLDLALRLFYEYTHALREDAILTILHGGSKLPPTLGSDQVAELVRQKNAGLQKEYSIKLGLSTNHRPNIAQGNAFQALLLYSLSQINGGYMPGARILDPHPSFIAEQQKKNPYFTNLYTDFKTFVVGSPQKAANIEWLRRAGTP